MKSKIFFLSLSLFSQSIQIDLNNFRNSFNYRNDEYYRTVIFILNFIFDDLLKNLFRYIPSCGNGRRDIYLLIPRKRKRVDARSSRCKPKRIVIKERGTAENEFRWGPNAPLKSFQSLVSQRRFLNKRPPAILWGVQRVTASRKLPPWPHFFRDKFVACPTIARSNHRAIFPENFSIFSKFYRSPFFLSRDFISFFNFLFEYLSVIYIFFVVEDRCANSLKIVLNFKKISFNFLIMFTDVCLIWPRVNKCYYQFPQIRHRRTNRCPRWTRISEGTGQLLLGNSCRD